MDLGPPDNNPDYSKWSTIRVKTCNGSATQKWNAPPESIPADTVGLNEKKR
jgi:hypothetical protein